MQADVILAGLRLWECGRERVRAAALVTDRSRSPAARAFARVWPLLTATAFLAVPSTASGPEYHAATFVDRIRLDDVLAGDYQERGHSHDDVFFSLIMYLQLTGRFDERHLDLFRSRLPPNISEVVYEESPGRKLQRSVDTFWWELPEVGSRGWRFGTEKYVSTGSRAFPDGNTVTTGFYFQNCLEDAFVTARRTFAQRREDYGQGSVELDRWVAAQLKVFAQCSGETEFDPPEEPGDDWLPLERHDRRYQIAAAYFYNGQYLEAASRFAEIGQTPGSPWRDLGRYLVARSLAREATINDNDRTRHLHKAIGTLRELAVDADYVDRFPSIPGLIGHLEARLDPVAARRALVQRIIEQPDSMTVEEMADYRYLRHVTPRPSGEDVTAYEEWRRFLFHYRLNPVDRWRSDGSLAWLYIALDKANANQDETTLKQLTQAAAALPPNAPGRLNMLLNRIRILGLLGQSDAGLRLAAEILLENLTRSQGNRVRLAAAQITTNWTDYLQWSSLKPVRLPWSPRTPNPHRITLQTTLFPAGTTELLNSYFTPTMILDVIDTPGLSSYQRGRMAIAGWTKAMLADDVEAALAFAPHIRRHVPRLDGDLALFEQTDDKHFEAARIIFDHPAFSPWMDEGAGRLHGRRPVPDNVTYGSTWGGWWCPPWRDHSVSEQTLRHLRFSRYSDREIAAIRKVNEARQTSATTSFGPHVIRYAKDNLNDPRVPKALHRLVFATRHACRTAPGEISRAAYSLLHRHFPHSEWAEKTPYWFDGRN